MFRLPHLRFHSLLVLLLVVTTRSLRTLTYLRLPSSPLDHLTNLQTLTHLHQSVGADSSSSSANHIILRPTSTRTSNYHYETYYTYEVYKFLHNLDQIPRNYIVHPPVENVVTGVQLEALEDLTKVYGTEKSVGTTNTASGLESHVKSVNSLRSSRSLAPLTYTILPTLNLPPSYQFFDFLPPSPDLPRPKGYDHVVVGGTWDRMHYGHRRLLTLAVSVVSPRGRLTIGVTAPQMVSEKSDSSKIEAYETRVQNTVDFVSNLARGFKNNLRVVEITDSRGTLVEDSSVDCIVCSSETVGSVEEVNVERKNKGWKKVEVWVAVRGDEGGMSSSGIRRMEVKEMK